MMILYLTLLLLLLLTRFVIWRRVTSLERKYSAIAGEAKKLAQKPQYKAGNSNKPRDTFVQARQYYELGKLVQKRDRVEAKYTRWQHASDQMNKVFHALSHWKGKGLPYAFGIVDVVLLALVLNLLGVTNLSGESLKQMFQSLFS